MNELKVTRGPVDKLVLTVWNDDTQQVVARNVAVLELFGSESELRGGRFARWDSEMRNHVVEMRGAFTQSYNRKLIPYIEWINNNIEGKWSFGFRDESVCVSSWGLLDFQLYLRFYFQEVEDAVLFKLRWI